MALRSREQKDANAAAVRRYQTVSHSDCPEQSEVASPSTRVGESSPTVAQRCSVVTETKGLSKELLDLAEVRHRLKCSKSHLSNIINDLVPGLPKLPVVALGRRKYVLEPTLDEWVLQVEGMGGYDVGHLDSTPETHGKGVNHHA